METTTNNKSTALDWILFLVSAVLCILLLIYADEWFWIPLPFALTYLVKALRAM
jgi:fatty acid desaturase